MSELRKTPKPFSNGRKSSRGVSLIEVLVSVLILGIGMLGIAAMQATALSNSQSSIERTQAVLHTYSIFDAMRANRDAALTDAFSPAGDTGLMCAPPVGGNFAANTVRQWVTDIIASNQTGCGRIRNVGNGVFEITVQWNDQRGTGGAAAQQLVTVSRL
jgi:type IV pilus assembly protein PilV